MRTKRVKAFTIMELTIAMLISVILIGITYSVYLIISRSYQSFNTKNDNMAMVLRLDELLKKDFNRAELILKDSAGITFQSLNNKIRYKFDTAYIVRIGGRTDTFKIKTDSVNTSFENQLITESGSTDKKNRLDQLDVSLLLQNQKIIYHYHKIYSSANLINRNPNAVN